MDWQQITDWNDAFDNRKAVDDFEAIPRRWAERAGAFRTAMQAEGRLRADLAYGKRPRNRLDLFLPEDTPQGLAVFLHGGYWRAFGKEYFSQLAAGAVGRGWAVAVPSYTLCPDASIPEITREAAEAVNFAAREIAGPLRLAGHSAGGHLVCRLVSTDTQLRPEVVDRIAGVLAISPVVDLRPLLENAWNRVYGLTERTAAAESPVLHEPAAGTRLTAWVGGDERPEFLRQAALIANIWLGLGAATRLVVEPGHTHFTVIDALTDPESTITGAWIAD